MDNKRFMTASEVADFMQISKSKAYRIIKALNEELNERGYIIVAGRVSTAFFMEKVYGLPPIG